MASTLTDPYLKTARAKEHLEELRERIRVFRESEPGSVTRQEDAENGLYILRFEIKNLPDKITLIVGDFLYCLRCSLDQLVWALAKQVGTYPQGTQFPIFRTPNPGKFSQYTADVPADAVSIIESLQPYHRGDAEAIASHYLWQLSLLCNIDKHRRIPVESTVIDFRFPEFPRELIPQIRFDHYAKVVIVPLDLKRYMTLDPVGTIDITFGDSHEGIKCNFARLEEIYEFVANSVIPRFSRFF
jgi:hypothetical protein